jgi:hypothetical protein
LATANRQELSPGGFVLGLRVKKSFVSRRALFHGLTGMDKVACEKPVSGLLTGFA